MGVQNYDNKLVGRGEIGINDAWHRIINYMPTKPAFFNNGYKDKIQVPIDDLSPQDSFSFVKRFGFTSIKLYKRNASETKTIEQTDQKDREITDIEEMGGFRYAFAVTKDRKKMRIYKQIGINHDTCTKTVIDPLTVGYFINIVSYEYKDKDGNTKEIDHFPFGKCVYDKFVIADRVKGKPSSSGEGSLKTTISGDNIVSTLNSNELVSASSGDYVFIYDGTYSGQVADVTNPIGNGLEIMGSWAGLWDVSMPSKQITIGAGNNILSEIITTIGSVQQASNEHKYKIFKEYGLILNFATLDGIFHLHYDEGKPSTAEFTYNNFTHSVTDDGNISPIKIVTSFNHYDSNINFLEKNYGMLCAGLFGYNKFMFSSANSSTIGMNYTHVINYSSYMLLLGPSHTGIFATRYKGQGVVDFAYCELDGSRGYFSPDSFDIDSGTLVIYTNSKKLFTLSVEYVGLTSSEADLSYGFFFKPVWQYQFSEYEGERKDLRLGVDDVFVTHDYGDFKFCISPKYDKNGNTAGTQIYQREIGKKFRYKWIVEKEKIRGAKTGIWFGSDIYNYAGYKDNGKNYKTIIGMFFGDQTMFSPKKLDYVKVAIGSSSYITNDNTILAISLYMDDRYQTFNYGNFGSTSYVQNIMKAKDHPDSEIMYDLPIDIVVAGGSGVGIDCNVTPTIENNINEFISFSPTKTTNSNIPNTVSVAKYGILMAPIGMLTSSIYAEIITEGEDMVELIGMFMSTDYIETYASKPDNTLTIKDRTLSGPSNKALTSGIK